MRTSEELNQLRAWAKELRRQGKSRREIKQILGPMSNTTLNEALAGEPPPDWTRRPNAKDELRAKARDLRTRGMSYDQIAHALGVAKSSVSLWVRDLPTPAIHENADVAAAEQFWLAFTGARREQFLKTTLKHHEPKTVRKNVGESYHGCLRIDVRRSSGLYRKIEGWVEAITSDA